MWVWNFTASAPASAMASTKAWASPRLPSWAWATSPTITQRWGDAPGSAMLEQPRAGAVGGPARTRAGVGARELVPQLLHQVTADPLDHLDVVRREQLPPPVGPRGVGDRLDVP